MRIGELAVRTGVATRMLRYYEEQGLLSPRRNPNGYRDYVEADVGQVTTIRDLIGSGVPTRFVGIVLDRRSGATTWTTRCDDILAGMVRDEIARIDTRIRSLGESRDALAGFVNDSR